MEEVRSLQKQVALQQELEALEETDLRDATPVNMANQTAAQLEEEYKRIFLKGLRRQRITADDHSIIEEYKNVMKDGGIT